jgi:hypothetical protein
MIASLKALIVVLAVAALVFRFVKPVALLFSAERDFLRRRNVWLVLTAVAFLSPSFWLFALVAVPLMLWAGRKDASPVALYLSLLHVIPPVYVDIPVVGINTLFALDNYRLLSFCVLIPTAWRIRQDRDAARIRGLQAMDVLLLGYGVLQVVLFVPPDLPNHLILHDSATNVVRRAALFFVDVYVLYYVVSRSCTTSRAIAEAMAAFCLACATIAAIAVFESTKGWLLYVDIVTRWSNDSGGSFYLMRGDTLRAQASTGHALALGYLLAIAFGFWLALQSRVPDWRMRIGVGLLLWLGLGAAYSRGPWMGAVAMYFIFAALGPRALRRMFKSLGAAALICVALAFSPLGARIVKVLPFMGGSVDSGNVLYRQRLATRAWELIQEHPWFGNQLAYTRMDDLRQGQGIIDLVNTYAEIALFYGLVGLVLLVGFLLIGAARTYRMARLWRADTELSSLGVSLVASILGVLIMIATSSFILGLPQMYYILGGLTAAYCYLRGPSAYAAPAAQSAGEPLRRTKLR